MKKRKTITICSSASLYKQVVEIEKELKQLGFKVILPMTARRMKKSGDYDLKKVKTWFNDSSDYYKKTKLMTGHLKEVKKGDITLVTNLEKHGVLGYIGGNVLMEMAIALFLKKKIYLLHQPDKNSPFLEEILGMQPVILDGDLSKIK